MDSDGIDSDDMDSEDMGGDENVIDSADVSELLVSMGEKTVAAAEGAEFDRETLAQLGETLVEAGESLQ